MSVDSVRLRAGAASDVGRVRTNNQDSYVLIHDRDLFVVADGMGGAQGGEVASQLAIEAIQTAYDEPTPEALVAAVERANDTIHERAAVDPELRGMGTTLTAAALMELTDDNGEPHPQVVIANVGDSRAYLFRQGELTQLTEDHSMVADLVRQGRLDPDEAEHHPQRNILTRVLGVYADVSVDVWPIDPVRGDRYLLCSDGLFNEVGPDQIAAVLRRYENDPQGTAGELVRQAVEAGGRDNVTVVVIDVVDDGGVAEAASAALAANGSDVDLAGFTTAQPSVDGHDRPPPPVQPSRRERRRALRRERRAERAARTRFTWRVLAFLLLLAGLVAGALYAIVWYGTSTYFVGFDRDEVVIYQGRPGGVLWIDPELEDRTDIRRAELPPRALELVEAEREQSSREEADDVVDNLERMIIEANESTTTTTATTTTAPPPPPPPPTAAPG